ncbi:sensor histidine kinase [Streptomyces sp. LS1784]|uniref:sensor histidine kinase n=1 Tax=Streptomyces sp. LS1784 TaxID=2851533 RepID=UPI001CCA219A|nr:histidine kinase [Streptomyces sp. LS1784]
MSIRSRRFAADIGLLAVGSLTVYLLFVRLAEWPAGTWLLGESPANLLVAACAVAATTARRRLPLAAVVVAAALVALDPLAGGVLPVPAYTAGQRCTRLCHRLALGTVLLGVPAAVTAASAVLGSAPLLDQRIMVVMVSTVVCGVLPGMAGALEGQRRRLESALRQRNAYLEQAQQAAEERARSHERARIAGEMHDLLGHGLSLAALHSGGLVLASKGTSPVLRESAVLVNSTVRQSMKELREILGVLRAAAPAAAEPLTGASGTRADIAALADESRAAGVMVRLDWQGADLAGAASPVRHAVHRVVREALTNVHKHAAASEVEVVVRHGRKAVTVGVRNGPVLVPRLLQPLPGSGLGLIGLHERVRLLGGTLRTAPTAQGGFAVEAHIPLDTPVGEMPEPLPHVTGRPTAASSPQRWLNRSAGRLVPVLGLIGTITLQFFTLVFVPYRGGEVPPAPPAELSHDEFVRYHGPGDPFAQAAVRRREPEAPADTVRACYPDYGDGPAARPTVHRYCFLGGRLVQDTVIPADIPVPRGPGP